MLSSIHPLGERGKGNRFGLTATAFVVGATLGGATTGAARGRHRPGGRWQSSPTAVAAMVARCRGPGRGRLRAHRAGRCRRFPGRSTRTGSTSTGAGSTGSASASSSVPVCSPTSRRRRSTSPSPRCCWRAPGRRPGIRPPSAWLAGSRCCRPARSARPSRSSCSTIACTGRRPPVRTASTSVLARVGAPRRGCGVRIQELP